MRCHRGWCPPPDYYNDGCTMAPDSLFGIDLRPACTLHDWLRRHVVHYGGISVRAADAVFRSHLKALGLPSWAATVYWLMVKLFRPWFRRTYPIDRPEWFPYLKQQEDTNEP